MKVALIISTILLTTSSIVVLKSTIKKSVKFKIKSKARPIDEDFILEILGKVGSHSNRKHGVTTARKSGCSKDDTDFCGRWKNSPIVGKPRLRLIPFHTIKT